MLHGFLSSTAETFHIQDIVMQCPPRSREWSVLRPFLIVIPLAMALALTALASRVAAEETRPEPELHTASGDPDHPRPWKRANTDWMHTARWGVLCHYLADVASYNAATDMTTDQWNAQIDAFDVQGLATQLAAIKAPYFFLTLGQNSGFYLAPNATYDRLTGIEPSKCSRRDIVAELIDALRPHGIRMCVYLPSDAPGNDKQASAALHVEDVALDPRRAQFQRKWQAVITEWSERWKSDVHAWWFDGCYYPDAMYRHEDEPNFRSFAAAAKAGNPDALVAFNPGVRLQAMSEYEDYTAGEIASLLPVDGFGRFLKGEQVYILTYLGPTWGAAPSRFSDDLVIAYTRHVASRGGVVTWDAAIDKSGRIEEQRRTDLQAVASPQPGHDGGT
jgi:alpha-L-fucosidase